MDVRVIVFRDGEILLIKEKEDGLWSLPGGWADIGESPAEATAREVREESGYRMRAVKLASLYNRDRQVPVPIPYHFYKLNFLCEILPNEEPEPWVDAAGVGVFGEVNLPSLYLTRVIPPLISCFFEHHRNPNLPTDFD